MGCSMSSSRVAVEKEVALENTPLLVHLTDDQRSLLAGFCEMTELVSGE